MRNIFELTRDELVWLEDKLQRYHQFDKEMAIRRQELSIQEHYENIGGGKSNISGRPTESQAVKVADDKYLQNRLLWKDAIATVYESASTDVKEIIHDKYWSDQSYKTWESIGSDHNISRSQAYRVRYDVLEAFAKEIGYI